MHDVSLLALSYDADLHAVGRRLQVHAVFPHTWLLRATDATILTVTTSPWNGPLTVRVEGPSLNGLQMQPGLPARLTETELQVGAVRIELQHAIPWKPATAGPPVQIPALRQDICLARERARTANRGGVMQALPLLSGLVDSRSDDVLVGAVPACRPSHMDRADGRAGPPLPDDSQAESPRTRQSVVTMGSAGHAGYLVAGNGVTAWHRHAHTTLSELLDALIREDGEAMVRHASGLLGLGPGLTPSGDDVLCGLLVGLSVLGRRAPAHAPRCTRARAEIAATVLPKARSATTALSRTLLQEASRGISVEPLLTVLCTLGSGAPVEGLDALLTRGHSSGSDMLAGAILASTAVIRWEESFGLALGGSP